MGLFFQCLKNCLLMTNRIDLRPVSLNAGTPGYWIFMTRPGNAVTSSNQRDHENRSQAGICVSVQGTGSSKIEAFQRTV